MARKRETARDRADKIASESLANLIDQAKLAVAAARATLSALQNYKKRLAEQAYKEGRDDGKNETE